MHTYLLDTTAISSLIKKRNDSFRIKDKLLSGLAENTRILISAVAFYEVARGLYHKEAKKQLVALEELASHLSWCDLSKSTWELGASLWADCRKQGTPTCDPKRLDADCLIAAQAKENKATIVTNNTRHFSYLGIDCESW